jgi:hypothetical protein
MNIMKSVMWLQSERYALYLFQLDFRYGLFCINTQLIGTTAYGKGKKS